MKTIEIQRHKNTNNTIDVIVNGKKHVMRHQSLKIYIADDEPFEIKVNQLFAASPLYTYDPKDNMVLQISGNWRIVYWSIVMMVVTGILIFIIEYFWGKGTLRFIVPWITPLGIFLLFIFRKKFFIIKEVNIVKQ